MIKYKPNKLKYFNIGRICTVVFVTACLMGTYYLLETPIEKFIYYRLTTQVEELSFPIYDDDSRRAVTKAAFKYKSMNLRVNKSTFDNKSEYVRRGYELSIARDEMIDAICEDNIKYASDQLKQMDLSANERNRVIASYHLNQIEDMSRPFSIEDMEQINSALEVVYYLKLY